MKQVTPLCFPPPLIHIMNSLSPRLSFREKAGYALGDAGANLVFQTLMVFQMTYYSKTLGLGASAVSWIFLIGRLFDAVIDPAMGVISDRTHTRWGRFRPWLLWSAIPFGLLFWAAFSVPNFSTPWKLIYVWGSYLALMAVYAVNNVPYCALNGVITGDINERTSVSSFRFFATMTTAFFVQGFTWPLVAKLGNGNDAAGWSRTIAIYAIISVGLFVITFFATKERIQPDPNQHNSVRRDIADAFGNRPWVLIFASTFAIFLMLSIRGGSLPLYTQFYADSNALTSFLGHLGLVPDARSVLTWRQQACEMIGYLVRPDHSNVQAVAFGLFNILGSALTLVGVLASKPLSERFGKRGVFTTCLALTAVSSLALFFIPAKAVEWQLIQGLIWSASYSPTIPLLWSMIADAADFGEWKNHRRATGFIFAGAVFALKAGLGVGGFIGGQVLGAYGFAEGAERTASSLMGIRMTVAVYPAIALGIAAVAILFYPLTKEVNERIGRELSERRTRFTTAA
jgi:glycoside/pentoside/hexuronide:cation symporter, GPH family